MQLSYILDRPFEMASFLRLPRFLLLEAEMEDLSMEAIMLYTLMLDRTMLSKANNWCDIFGRTYIYYTLLEIQRNMKCGQNKAIRLVRELEDHGLIERRKQGQGKPSIIFVMYPGYRELRRLKNLEGLSKKNSSSSTVCDTDEKKSGAFIMESPELLEGACNNTENNNTEKNNIESVNHGAARVGAEAPADYYAKSIFLRLRESLRLHLGPDR